MTLLRELIDIPESVADSDFVIQASAATDLQRYVVTEQLKGNFSEALKRIGHALDTGKSQAMFLHGSFGSGKSHFMAVLREVLRHNPAARAVRGMAGPIDAAERWLPGKRILTLTFHMLDAQSVEQAVLEGYLNQITALHPDEAPPAVHHSDALLLDAANLRADLGDEKFFARLRAGGVDGPGGGGGLAAMMARQAGWTSETYEEAAAAEPGTEQRDRLVSALTMTFFTNSVRSGDYLDLDSGLKVITRHAKGLKYDAVVFFLDELILWLSTKIADPTFVNTEGAKLNKLVESSDAARPLPIVSFVARQRNLEDFLGPQVGGTERAALADVMRSVQGRLGEIVLADTDLPEITEKRLLRPRDDQARGLIDAAFADVRGNREVWDILLLGAQYGQEASVGSDATAFRKLYPFSPALVATLVALSQALQRERTALRIMTDLLVDRRDTLRVNDLIGVADLFEPIVLRGELPDRPALKQKFLLARTTYVNKLRPELLSLNEITENEAAGHQQFQLDDRLVRTLLLGALVPEVPVLHNLTAAKLHALNFGSITAPVPGYESHVILERLRRLADHAGGLHVPKGDTDPVITLKLSAVDYDQLLDLVPHNETTTGVLQQLVREAVSKELGLGNLDGTLGELQHPRDWRGRRHLIQVRFGNVRDPDTMPDAALVATGESWRIVIDYPFDMQGYGRNSDTARMEQLPRGSRSVFWLPLYLTDDMIGRVRQLAKIDYLLGSDGTGARLNTLAADWSLSDRQQGKVYLEQRQMTLRGSLVTALKRAYGADKQDSSDVEIDSIPVLHTLMDGLRIGDPRGGTLKAAFDNLTGELLSWAYPGKPHLPDDERPITRGELTKVLHYARHAAADPTRGTAVPKSDQSSVRRICNHLRLGELVDHRYVLDASTCFWSGHLSQRAAQRGYTKHFPVHVLRTLFDEPEPRGLDLELQNLIIAVFALEQQLAWYDGTVKVPVGSVAENIDRLELRKPPMPDEDVWVEAVRRGQSIFGEVLPLWHTPANLAEVASTVRRVARDYRPKTDMLVQTLVRHAEVLGLDESSATGRLATARRVATLLSDMVEETDDVVLVGLVAGANVGEIDDIAASVAFKQAEKVTRSLVSAQWPLLEAVRVRAASDEPARVIIDQLQADAQYDQHAADLAGALDVAARSAADLLAKVNPPPDPTPPVIPPVRPPMPGSKSRQVSDLKDLDGVAAEIRADVQAGRRVTVTWEVQ